MFCCFVLYIVLYCCDATIRCEIKIIINWCLLRASHSINRVEREHSWHMFLAQTVCRSVGKSPCWSVCLFDRKVYCGKITELIEYNILSITYKVLTTVQPSYLHHLINVQPHRSTRSSSVVTLSRPPSSSSLRITERSFRYASPRLWNQLLASLRQPRASHSVFDSDLPTHASSAFSINSPLSTSITPSLFHSPLKTYLFHRSFPP